MNVKTAIAQHLTNQGIPTEEDAIVKIIEMWKVYSVVVAGRPARFVSKSKVDDFIKDKELVMKGINKPEVLAVCKRTGLEFEAPSKRYKQHPTISGWLQKASTEGWYRDCVETIEALKNGGATTIEEYIVELEIVRPIAIAANEKKQNDRETYWEKIKEEFKERRRQNATLRNAGYRWRNLAYEPEDPDQADWSLISPEGEIVSVQKALTEIESRGHFGKVKV